MLPNAIKVSHGFLNLKTVIPPMPEQTTQQGYYDPVALDILSGAGKTNTVEQITERIYNR